MWLKEPCLTCLVEKVQPLASHIPTPDTGETPASSGPPGALGFLPAEEH